MIRQLCHDGPHGHGVLVAARLAVRAGVEAVLVGSQVELTGLAGAVTGPAPGAGWGPGPATETDA